MRIGGIASSASASVTFRNSGLRGKNAMKSAISATLGTARPTLEVVMARNEPLPVWPRISPSGSAIASARPIAARDELQVLPQQRQVVAAADGRPALVLARREDEADRVAELAQGGEGERHRAALVHGVSTLLQREHEQVEHDRQQHAQPARDDDVGAELGVGEDRLAEAAGAGQEDERGQADRGRDRDPQAGHDLRQRQRQLDAPQQLAGGEAHAAPGVARLGGHAVQARDHVAEDDQQRVGRRARSAPWSCRGR